jgi:hypothetical protein
MNLEITSKYIEDLTKDVSDLDPTFFPVIQDFTF